MGGVSIWHWLVVGLVFMMFFGRGKISEMMGDMAKGIKAFKKGMADEETPPAATHPVTPLPSEPVRTLEGRNADAVATGNSTLADRKLG